MYLPGEFVTEEGDEIGLAQTSDYLCDSGLFGDSDLCLDRALLRGGGGGNWIALDFRGVVFWSYVALLGVDVTLSSIAVLGLPKAGLLRIHLGSMVFAVLLLITGVAVYGKLRRAAMSNEYRTTMANRRPLMNAIELKNWWYVPDESHPTEIRVSVVVHEQVGSQVT